MIEPQNWVDEEYMGPAQLEHFRQLLRTNYKLCCDTIDSHRLKISERPELNDEADRAQYEEEVRIALRIIDRESKHLKKLEKALKRIADGEYGYCLATGEEIGLERLLARPEAEYCAESKRINEHKETGYAKK